MQLVEWTSLKAGVSVAFTSRFEQENAEKLQKITQWGDIAWKDFNKSFYNCSNLDVNATDTPDLTDVNSAAMMFERATKLKGNKYFNDWDVSSVTDMYAVFADATIFNQPLNNWNVSSVDNMRYMFYEAKAFNQPLNNWNVSSVTKMSYVFLNTKAFNQPLYSWNVSNVTNMRRMFKEAKAFKNQDLSSWNVGNVDKHTDFMKDSGGGNTEPNWN